MEEQIKIVVAGIGGVGGYFGGLLAKQYANSESTKVYFIARGEHLKQIQKSGLTVIKGEQEFNARPYLATANPDEIGIADFILICTKNYDLEAIIAQLSPCIGKHTTILPLLNGIEGVHIIKSLLPNTLIASGCAYIVSAIKAPGVVENMGNRQEIYFGLDQQKDLRLVKLEELLKLASIEAKLAPNILKVIWEKFIFLSCIATATSYFDKSVGKLLEEHRETLLALIDEVSAIALHKGITIDEQMKVKAMQHYESLPYEATSSMHRDYLDQKPKTELSSITGYVVKEGLKLNVATPLFSKANAYLLNK